MQLLTDLSFLDLPRYFLGTLLCTFSTKNHAQNFFLGFMFDHGGSSCDELKMILGDAWFMTQSLHC